MGKEIDMTEQHEKEISLGEYKKYFPKEAVEDLETVEKYDCITFSKEIELIKVFEKGALSEKELEALAKQLHTEWIETVVKPATKAIAAFCEKYKVAPATQSVTVTAKPLKTFFMQQMLSSSLGDLGKMLK